MKKDFVKTLEIGEEIQEFFVVKSASVRTDRGGKEYFDVTLADNTGEINGKKWDIPEHEKQDLESYEIGDIIKVKATIGEYNNNKQLSITKHRRATEEDGLSNKDFFKAAPESSVSMFSYIINVAEKISDEDYKKMCLALLERNKEKLLYYPAASKNHHSIYGGLLYHTKRMLMQAERLCEVYPELDANLLFTGVIFHDIEKINEMDSDKNGVVKEFTLRGMMLGHLIMGVVSTDKLADELGINEEKAILLEHMLLSHHYEPEFGSPKRPLFAEAEALHYLDMIDSKLYDFQNHSGNTKLGSFSDKVFTLHNRRVYKKTW